MRPHGAPFQAGEAVATRNFQICGPDPDTGQFVCDSDTWAPKVIIIYVP